MAGLNPARSVAGSCIAHESLSAGRAVKPRSRKAVREAQGLTARTSPKPSFAGLVSATRADAVRLIKSRILQLKDGKVELYRAKLKLSFKYETSNQ